MADKGLIWMQLLVAGTYGSIFILLLVWGFRMINRKKETEINMSGFNMNQRRRLQVLRSNKQDKLFDYWIGHYKRFNSDDVVGRVIDLKTGRVIDPGHVGKVNSLVSLRRFGIK